MSEIGTSEGASVETEKPVIEDVKFPPFPDPSDKDFDEDLSEEEKAFYKKKFPDINEIVNVKLHCTACDRHLGCSARNESRMRPHPMLRTLICHTCHSFYNSGEFDKGEDGSELYCRWCGQGGQVYCCSDCVHVFCAVLYEQKYSDNFVEMLSVLNRVPYLLMQLTKTLKVMQVYAPTHTQKCIKRNLGVAKIKEIENTDDWKCFKCNPKCLWDLRAVCWALLRFCDIRNKIVFHTEDPQLKEKYQKAVATDMSECCKNKGRKKEKTDSAKKKEKEADIKKTIPKLPPTIQVKKFASINLEDTPKIEKKSLKRPASPKPKLGSGYIQKPISIAPCPLSTPPLIKKVRLPTAPLMNSIRFGNEKKNINTYTRMPNRPRQPFPIPIVNTPYNGMSHPYTINMPSLMGDNINLSLETLTQGLDMAAVAAFNNTPSDTQCQSSNDNDVVCTPDFPMEPLCEVTEDNDDDVQCITPGPVVPPKINNPPPLVPRSLPDISSDNIVQMTDNDVTVNTLTGGLKFRVDPQTLSSKKMYRLPDGRIFAINPNPTMPGGYSATIVSVSDAGGKVAPKGGGETYAAKLSAITPSPTLSGSNSKPRNSNNRKPRKSTPRSKAQKSKETVKETRECDLKVPIEWYRYNLIDAVDALDYSLSRLNKLKKEATTTHLRTRTVDEIKYLHRTLEQLLTTSSKRFLEIRDSLNKELKQYITRKSQPHSGDMTEDDDVEFLPNAGNDDPIFIDENSVDSVSVNDSHEVDLTGAASSEHNDSTENKNESDSLICNEDSTAYDKNDNNSIIKLNDSMVGAKSILSVMLSKNHDENEAIYDKEDADMTDKQDVESNDKRNVELDAELDDKQNAKLDDMQDSKIVDKQIAKLDDKQVAKLDGEQDTNLNDEQAKIDDEQDDKQNVKLNDKQDVELSPKRDCAMKEEGNDKNSDNEDSCKLSSKQITDQKIGEINSENKKANHNDVESLDVDSNKRSVCEAKAKTDDEQTQDIDMSEEMIETLLKDTDNLDGTNNVSNTSHLNVLEELRDKP